MWFPIADFESRKSVETQTFLGGKAGNGVGKASGKISSLPVFVQNHWLLQKIIQNFGYFVIPWLLKNKILKISNLEIQVSQDPSVPC